MINITREAALPILREIVAEEGSDFIYERVTTPDGGRCVYVEPFSDKPSCIVGRLLAKVGVPVEEIRKGDLGSGVGAAVLLSNLEGRGILAYSHAGKVLLDIAQREQDGGTPWGLSVGRAEKGSADLNDTLM